MPLPVALTLAGRQTRLRSWTSPRPDEHALTAVLIHGGAAHGAWWEHLAQPLLGAGFSTLVAPDLSGHGDADHHDSYSLVQWSAEVTDLAGRLPGRPVLIGHSLGGLVAVEAAHAGLAPWYGVIVVESPIGVPRHLGDLVEDGSAPRRTYLSKEAALARFRLSPPQPPPFADLVRYIAEHSVREVGDGEWAWKFDPRILTHEDVGRALAWADLPEQYDERVALLAGDRSDIIGTRAFERGVADLGPDRVHVLPGHHHLILDEPDAFVSTVAQVVSGWTGRPTASPLSKP